MTNFVRAWTTEAELEAYCKEERTAVDNGWSTNRAELSDFLRRLDEEIEVVRIKMKTSPFDPHSSTLPEYKLSTWEAIAKHARSLLEASEEIAVSQPKLAERIANDASKLIWEASGIVEITHGEYQDEDSKVAKSVISIGLSSLGRKASKAAAERRQPAIDARRKIIEGLVRAIPTSERRIDDALKVAISIADDVNAQLVSQGLAPVSESTIRRDIISLN